MIAAVADFDVVCCSRLLPLQSDIVDAWLQAKSESECLNDVVANGNAFPVHCIISEVQDQYNILELLERQLISPSLLNVLPLSHEDKNIFVQRYYSFDEALMRELLGKKLSSRTRKDIEDVALKLNINSRSCKRQFENIRRVSKGVEDLSGRVEINIHQMFGLDHSLAEQYACIVFLGVNRFDTKKRVQSLRLCHLQACAQSLVDNWTTNNNNLDIDKDLLQHLKLAKGILDRDIIETAVKFVAQQLDLSTSNGQTAQDILNNLKGHIKTVVSIGVELCHKGDLRDIFVDTLEKLAIPLKQSGWSISQVDLLLNAINLYISQSEIQVSANAWTRYNKVLQAILRQINLSLDKP